jgi:putative exporter of polyketide antibiotics
VLGATVLVAGGALGGIATWVGAISDHANVNLSSLFNAGLNVAFPALLLFGVGVFALGVVPRLVNVITYSVFVWFVLVELIGSEVKMNHWVLDLSAFHQMAASPGAPVAWTANATMAGIALASATLGVMLFRRRDLKGE